MERAHEAARGEEGAGQIGRDHPLPPGELHVGDVDPALVDAGRIDQDGGDAEIALDPVERRMHRLLLAHVALRRHAPGAGVLDLAQHRLSGGFIGVIE